MELSRFEWYQLGVVDRKFSKKIVGSQKQSKNNKWETDSPGLYWKWKHSHIDLVTKRINDPIIDILEYQSKSTWNKWKLYTPLLQLLKK